MKLTKWELTMWELTKWEDTVLLNPDESMPAHTTNCDIYMYLCTLCTDYNTLLRLYQICVYMAVLWPGILRMQPFAIRY